MRRPVRTQLLISASLRARAALIGLLQILGFRKKRHPPRGKHRVVKSGQTEKNGLGIGYGYALRLGFPFRSWIKRVPRNEIGELPVLAMQAEEGPEFG